MACEVLVLWIFLRAMAKGNDAWHTEGMRAPAVSHPLDRTSRNSRILTCLQTGLHVRFWFERLLVPLLSLGPCCFHVVSRRLLGPFFGVSNFVAVSRWASRQPSRTPWPGPGRGPALFFRLPGKPRSQRRLLQPGDPQHSSIFWLRFLTDKELEDVHHGVSCMMELHGAKDLPKPRSPEMKDVVAKALAFRGRQACVRRPSVFVCVCVCVCVCLRVC